MDPAIRDRFRSIDIPVHVARSPREFSRRILNRDVSTLFMIDVRTRKGRSRPVEYLLVYCGPKATVQAIDVNRRHRQVLLEVQEPESKLKTVRFEQHGRKTARIEEELLVKASRRRMLVGRDESHLFVCPLSQPASSVLEAHRKLAPEQVHRARHSLKVQRQGEWFFLPETNRALLEQIEERVRDGLVSTRKGLTAGGRPHRADELVELGEWKYVRGKVRHPDHRVIQLKSWHRVVRNTEEIEVRPLGMRWMTWTD